MERNNKEQTGPEIQNAPAAKSGGAARPPGVHRGDGRAGSWRTLRYSSKPMRLLPSLSSALNMSTAAALSELLLRALRSSEESISPLPSASASSNTALRAKISFLLYFLDILDSAPDMSAVGETRRAWRGHRCVASGGPFAFVNQQQRSHLLVRSSAWISGLSTSLWLESNVFQC